MNIIEWILYSIGLKPKNEREQKLSEIRKMEQDRAQTMLKLAREKNKPFPDLVKVEECEHRIAALNREIKAAELDFGIGEKKKMDHERLLKNIEKLEKGVAEARTRLERERGAMFKDKSRIELYERNLETWEKMLEMAKEARDKCPPGHRVEGQDDAI